MKARETRRWAAPSLATSRSTSRRSLEGDARGRRDARGRARARTAVDAATVDVDMTTTDRPTDRVGVRE
jgi:hypothetical protein